MSILDRFRKKSAFVKTSADKQDKKATKHDHKHEHENVLNMVKDHPEKSDKTQVALKENTGRAHQILQHYHLSEKSNLFANSGRYVFRVSRNANKIEIKKAIEKVYDVHVTKVNVQNVLGKSRRQGKSIGTTQAWKKAVVTLKSGERISGLAEGV